MSAPKKGKDLSALKARLAQKARQPAGQRPGANAPQTGGPRPRGRAPSAPPQQPAAPGGGDRGGRVDPGVPSHLGGGAPQQPAVPQSFAEPQPQAPAQAPTPPAPAQDLPSAPARSQSAARSPGAGQSHSGDPFGGGEAFDPNEGLIGDVGGAYKPKSGATLIGVGVLIGCVVGVGLGWMANISLGTRGKVEVAQRKAAAMTQEVQEISKARKSLALEWGSVKSQMLQNPPAATQKLKGVVEQHFSDRYAKVEALFGWPLATMNRKTIDSTFSLYRSAQNLKSHLTELARISLNEGKLLTGNAPGKYAVIINQGSNQAQLVELVNGVCGKVEEGKACTPGNKPTGFAVRVAPGAQPQNLPLEKVSVLIPKGPFYAGAFGSSPKEDVRSRISRVIGEIDRDLEAMNTQEKLALEAYQRYQASPTVDASSVQPE